MKKTYEKPRLVALSLSGNDLLCAACPIDAVGPNMDPFLSQIIGDFNIENVFGAGTDCPNGLQVEGYCKFTSSENGGQIVFNS